MANTTLRVFLISLFLLSAYIIYQKGELSLTQGVRQSRLRQKSTNNLVYPHVGALKNYRPQRQSFQRDNLLDYVSFQKKINTYGFTFYNWYHFEIQFVDLAYESFVEFRTFTQDHLHDRWAEKIGFKLDQGFYPRGGSIRLPPKEGSNCSGCCGCGQRGMNFDISTKILNISARQYTVKNLSQSRHDGYRYSRFWYYTPDKQLNDPQNQPFKSDLTITTFNISYINQKRVVQANLTHVLRHNHCISFVDQQNQGVFRHKCFAGYSSGRIFLDRILQHPSLPNHGKWVKSSFNLDTNRSRTYFEGVRSTHKIAQRVGGETWTKTNWNWRGFKAFMQCFSKPQYYQKHERIQKQRYVGLHFGRPFAASSVQNFQDFIFFNGKTYPVHQLDYKFSEKYQLKRNITFSGKPTGNIVQPSFEFNFTILSQQNYQQQFIIAKRSERRAYGFWSGWIEQGQQGERVDFFNITGFIETTNSIY